MKNSFQWILSQMMCTIYIYGNIDMYICIYVNMYKYVVYIFVNIEINIYYIHIYMYIYIYVNTCGYTCKYYIYDMYTCKYGIQLLTTP